MQFNGGKCLVSHISRKDTSCGSERTYTLDGQLLEYVRISLEAPMQYLKKHGKLFVNVAKNKAEYTIHSG